MSKKRTQCDKTKGENDARPVAKKSKTKTAKTADRGTQDHVLERYLNLIDINYGSLLLGGLAQSIILTLVSKGSSIVAKKWRSECCKLSVQKALKTPNYRLAEVVPSTMDIDTSEAKLRTVIDKYAKIGKPLPTTVTLLELQGSTLFTSYETVRPWLETITTLCLSCEGFPWMMNVGMPRLKSLTLRSRDWHRYLTSMVDKMPSLKHVFIDSPVHYTDPIILPDSVESLEIGGACVEMSIGRALGLTTILCQQSFQFASIPESVVRVVINKPIVPGSGYVTDQPHPLQHVRQITAKSIWDKCVLPGLTSLEVARCGNIDVISGFQGLECLTVEKLYMKSGDDFTGKFSQRLKRLHITCAYNTYNQFVPICGRIGACNATLTSICLTGSLANMWPFMFDEGTKFPVLESVEFKQMLFELREDRARDQRPCVEAVFPSTIKRLVIGETETHMCADEDPRRHLFEAIKEGMRIHGASRLHTVSLKPLVLRSDHEDLVRMLQKPGVYLEVRPSRWGYPIGGKDD